MERNYTVSQDPQSKFYYAHKAGFSNIPCMSERGTFHKTRRAAQQVAADCMALQLKDYLSLKES